MSIQYHSAYKRKDNRVNTAWHSLYLKTIHAISVKQAQENRHDIPQAPQNIVGLWQRGKKIALVKKFYNIALKHHKTASVLTLTLMSTHLSELNANN